MDNFTLIAIIIIFCVVILFGVMAFFATQEGQDKKEFCEAEGGEYSLGECLLKENGLYQSYEIREVDDGWRLVK